MHTERKRFDPVEFKPLCGVKFAGSLNQGLSPVRVDAPFSALNGIRLKYGEPRAREIPFDITSRGAHGAMHSNHADSLLAVSLATAIANH